MSTPNPVLHPAHGSGRLWAWIRDRSHWLVALLAVAAIAAVSALTTGPAGVAPEQPAQGDGDGLRVVPSRSTESPLLIDHSVVKSKSLLEEPDMTGASIGTYAP